MFKKVKKILTAVLFCSVLLSGCGDSPPSETVTETTEQTTVTMPKYTEEELDQMAQNMPEIVFVMSHHYEGSNIVGYYVTNTGEIKLYDFRQIAPDETYKIPDVYDRLEEAGCLEISPSEYSNHVQTSSIKSESIILDEALQKQYKSLLMVEQDSTCNEHKSLADMVQGTYELYGIRNNINNEKEIILLYGGGDYIYQREDNNANELAIWMRHDENFYKIFQY